MLKLGFGRGGSLSGGSGLTESQVQDLIDASLVSIDHGTLDGLGDDDHTQYILANATRAFSAKVLGADAGYGFSGHADLALTRSGSEWVMLQNGGVRSFKWANSAYYPDSDNVLALGLVTNRWAGIHNSGQETQALPAVKTVSGAIAVGERNTIWLGTGLTATLPINPGNGDKRTLTNVDVTALTVTAGAGDTLHATAPTGLAFGAAQTYVFLASTRVWYPSGN
jgi:hypothetical protein